MDENDPPINILLASLHSYPARKFRADKFIYITLFFRPGFFLKLVYPLSERKAPASEIEHITPNKDIGFAVGFV